MKKAIVTVAALMLLCFCLLTACVPAEKPLTDEEKQELISEAYIYAFPLVLVDATKTLSTNTVTPVKGRSPVNQLIHGKELADASFRTVVTPNVDTVYTQGWLDLGAEPMVYVMPEADRFFNVQVLDAWTNTVTVLDQAGTYVFVTPDSDAVVPENVTKVEVPTNYVWLIARVVLSDKEDLPNVYEIQNGMNLLPLSAYNAGGDYVQPEGTYDAANDSVPVSKVLSMSPKEFFDKANALMEINPPAEADAELLKKFAKINVGPGMTFDASVIPSDSDTEGEGFWVNHLKNFRQTVVSCAPKFASKLGQWTFYGSPIGDFGTEYTYRAMVALVGLGANTNDVAIYPKTDCDINGNRLSGEKTYILHFDSLPSTLEKGFWSITAYGSDDFLIDNPINRYCVNDRSGFILNEDGSLDIVLSKDAPQITENWLPVGDGEFHLFMRIYLPDMEALKTWNPPTISVLA